MTLLRAGAASDRRDEEGHLAIELAPSSQVNACTLALAG